MDIKYDTVIQITWNMDDIYSYQLCTVHVVHTVQNCSTHTVHVCLLCCHIFSNQPEAYSTPGCFLVNFHAAKHNINSEVVARKGEDIKHGSGNPFLRSQFHILHFTGGVSRVNFLANLIYIFFTYSMSESNLSLSLSQFVSVVSRQTWAVLESPAFSAVQCLGQCEKIFLHCTVLKSQTFSVVNH